MKKIKSKFCSSCKRIKDSKKNWEWKIDNVFIPSDYEHVTCEYCKEKQKNK